MTPLAQTTPLNPGPIACARDRGFVDTPFGGPNLAEAMGDLFRPMTVGVVQTTISSDERTAGEAKNAIKEVRTAGLLQPGSAEKLEIKAEGDRSWDNAILHCRQDLDVPTGTIIVIEKLRFKIMGKKNFSPYGYFRYDLVESYK